MIVLKNSLRRTASNLTIALVLVTATHLASGESPKDAEAAGATLFRDKGCAYCHGAGTQGTAKGPSLIHVRKALKAQQIADQIKNGGQKMPSFEESLSPDEINQLVAYLRAKHRPAPAPLPAPPVKSTGDSPTTGVSRQ